ncbi:hypothetical protein [Micromonospora sp. NPDC005367]|uniref:hypothetical protein n=1 Tax=Micromonospora sp. NPDC005367 TaxID=3155590 RepID=UPI00339DC1B0
MSEAGQPGAATPGEHGDGTGQQDDPSRSAGGWAPPAAAWYPAGDPGPSGEPAARWAPDPSSRWASSSPRHGDLPAPVAGLSGDAEPPSRVNGHHANGVTYAADEASVGRPAQVSAPPGTGTDERRDPGSERLVVPAQRPAPAAEQTYGPNEPEPGPARHVSEEPPGTRPRWTEPGLPTSAPPAVQIPPVGTAPSGFEVPPGFQAPTAAPSAVEGQPPAEQHGWPEAYPSAGEQGPAQSWPPTESPAGEPDWSGPSWNRPSWGSAWAPAWSRSGEEQTRQGRESDDVSGHRAGEAPSARRPAETGEPAGRHPHETDPPAGQDREAHEPAPRQERDADEPTGRRAREAEDLAGRRVREAEDLAGRRAHEAEEPAGRRAREESRPAWAGEPHQPYEPVRAEPSGPYETTRAEPEPSPVNPPAWAGGRTPFAPAEAPSEPGPPPVDRPAWAAERSLPGSESSGLAVGPERPAWAVERSLPGSESPGPAVASERQSWEAGAEPTSVPPVGPAGTPAGVRGRPAWAGGSGVSPAERPSWAASRPTTAPPVVREPNQADRPEPTPRRAAEAFRRRPASADAANRTASEAATPATTTGRHDPDPTPGVTRDAETRTGPAPASATSGADRHDHPAAAASAPGYAARRSAPEPAPTEDQSVGRQPDPASAVLPQRVPAEPDVPVVPEPPAVEPPAETPQLARIATHLRRDDEPAPPQERPEGFDVNAILGAVREVAGVRDASLRRTPAGAHSLRLDLADGADPADVSRQVARLLQERMGLAAAPQNLPGLPAAPPAPVRRRNAGRAPEPARPAGAARAPEAARSADAGREVREGRPAEADGRAPGEAAGRAPRTEPEPLRRRRPSAPPRGRATVDEAVPGAAIGSPVNLGASYSGAQLTTTESAPSRPLDTGGRPGPRVVIDHVQVSTFGLDANVEVRLIAAGETASGYATGPAVDGYVLRLCAVAAASAVDELLRRPVHSEGGRCFVEHVAVVPFGNCEVATVVVLLVCDGWVEQLAGSALVAGDPRQAVVRATLAAVNRRLEALLS